MQITTNGIVIHEKVLNNDNRILTILTEKCGVVHAFTKAVRKLASSLAASTELFSYSSFVLFYGKERYTVDKADSIRIFFQLRMDLEKLSLASYLAELMVELAPEQESTEEYLRLFLNCLYMLETGKRSLDFIKPLFELRLLTLAGYMPDLVGCRGCGKYEGNFFYFSPRSGSILCEDCRHTGQGEKMERLTKGQLTAMRHIIYSDMKNLFQFRMPNDSIKELNRIVEQYLLMQLDKSFPSLEFYHSILIS